MKVASAMLFGLSLWFCPAFLDQGKLSSKTGFNRKALRLAIPVALLTIVFLGFSISTFFVKSSITQERNIKSSLGNSLGFLLRDHFSRADILVENMSFFPELSVVLSTEEASLDKVNYIFDHSVAILPGSVAYLMNSKGDTISSSNRNSPSTSSSSQLLRVSAQRA